MCQETFLRNNSMNVALIYKEAKALNSSPKKSSKIGHFVRKATIILTDLLSVVFSIVRHIFL